MVDSRESREGDVIRRRRQCLNDKCKKRFTSYERIEEIPYMVVKKDGTRERFERSKLVAGLLKACEKRPIKPSASTRSPIAPNRAERSTGARDVLPRAWRARHVGAEGSSQVAYVRFASVYRYFRDVDDFAHAVRALKGTLLEVLTTLASSAPSRRPATPEAWQD